jgi:hypothetical protein
MDRERESKKKRKNVGEKYRKWARSERFFRLKAAEAVVFFPSRLESVILFFVLEPSVG